MRRSAGSVLHNCGVTRELSSVAMSLVSQKYKSGAVSSRMWIAEQSPLCFSDVETALDLLKASRYEMLTAVLLIVTSAFVTVFIRTCLHAVNEYRGAAALPALSRK